MGSRRGTPALQTPTEEFEVPKSMPHGGIMCDAPASLDLAVEWKARDFGQFSPIDKSAIVAHTVAYPEN
jgi:hypothetical protein